ncbi:MAG: hypothetical protein KatS3mg115_1586 [Candidatus Poribacteria bacterium]|nr:MAG: hypothetical protein KatS3mg115_1586 [Candidatus Poribacteria bacterium]
MEAQALSPSQVLTLLSPADIVLVNAYLRGRGLDPALFWKRWSTGGFARAAPLLKSNRSLKFRSIFELIQRIGDAIPGHRQKYEGVVFTPAPIVGYINRRVILEAVAKQNRPVRVLDPACGAGAFLADALLKLVETTGLSARTLVEEHLWGFELSPELAASSALVLSLLTYELERTLPARLNLFCGNALSPEFLSRAIGGETFDAVIGNPPYIRVQNLSEEMREVVRRSWRLVRGDTDAYIAFFELGLRVLSDRGRLGYITPKSFFSSYAGRALRDHLVQRRYLEELVDFGHLQVFEGVTTYAAITICAAERGNHVRYVRVTSPEEFHQLAALKAERFDLSALSRPRWLFPPPEVREQFELLRRAPLRLQDVADIRVGLATLRDHVYIFRDAALEGDYLIVRRKGARFRIERSLCRPIVKASRVAHRSSGRSSPYFLIFPYRIVDGRAVLIEESELSARYPEGYAYLLAHKEELSRRDRGKGSYPAWYAFGRTQGLTTTFGPKVLTPMMARTPSFAVSSDPEATFYSGYGVFPHTSPYTDLELLCRILNSEAMQVYIRSVSREYRGGWWSYAKTFIKDFPIPFLDQEDRTTVLRMEKQEMNAWLWERYRTSSVGSAKG